MKILLDEMYAGLKEYLETLGYEVLTAQEAGLKSAKDREIVVSCLSGQRSYFAARILVQHGFAVRNLTGSYRTWSTARTG